jgi:glucose-specific phosphotransferase system IIA component
MDRRGERGLTGRAQPIPAPTPSGIEPIPSGIENAPMASILLTAPMQGWATPIDEVPDAVFSERMLGDGVAIDPTGDCLYAPCAATVLTLLPSGHAITLATPEGAEILIHIGLDTVALGGRGFSPCVAVGDTVERGAPLIRFDLDLLVREARAVVTPIVVVNPDRFRIVHAVSSELVAIGDPLMTLEPSDAVAHRGTSQDGTTHERTVVVPLPHGIHARPAALDAEADDVRAVE